MQRRQFLKGFGYVGLLAMLQACRIAGFESSSEPVANVATAVPNSKNTRLPTFTATASPTPSPTASITPTASHTPTPLNPGASPTLESTPEVPPTDTPTPTPTPTPYPPGPPSKLGLFLTQFQPEVLEMINTAKPAIIKTLEIDANYAKGLKEASPTSLMIGRLVVGQLNLEADPIPLARSFVEELLPLAADPKRLDAFDAWEGHNEPVADTADKMKRLADFEAERTRLLAEQGIRSVVGNFGVGNPPLELWPEFKPALDAVRQYDGFLGLHEYSAPVIQYLSGSFQPPGDPGQGDEGWLTLRYRKVYRQFLTQMGFDTLPILITECGVDGLIQPRPGPPEAMGWQDFVETWLVDGLRDDPPGVYMDQLIWYDQNLQQDDYIKGAAVFLAGTNDSRWDSYNILGPGAGHMIDLLTQYLEVHPPA